MEKLLATFRKKFLQKTEIGADGYAANASFAVDKIKELMGTPISPIPPF